MSREIAKDVLRIEAEAIYRLIDRLDVRFEQAIELLLRSRGRVIVSGMGKSGIIGKKIAATLNSTGTPAYFLHPAEALHGDLGLVVEGDVLLALSNSGETAELLRLLEFVQRLGLSTIVLVGTPGSTLEQIAEVALDVSIEREACPLGLAPTASTTVALAMGDALALALAARRGFSAEDFARRHPGGRLGVKLVQVKKLMRTGADLPRVPASAPLVAAIAEMSAKRLGMTTVVGEDGRLVGVITDGDLRRLLGAGGKVESTTAGECCTRGARTIDRNELASRALASLERYKITSLVVVDDEERVEGVIHLHDLWRLELF